MVCQEFPGVEKALQIYEVLDEANMQLDEGLKGERKYDENRPVFVSSFPLKSFDLCSRMSRFIDLDQLEGVDLGGGIGGFGFQAANHFRKFTMVEILKPLHENAERVYLQLKKDGLVGDNVKLVNGDFLSPDFDITPYSFVYLFKPIYDNEEKIVELLLKTKPGTLILADLFMWLYRDPAFKMVPMPPSLNTRGYAHLFRRQA